MILTLVLAASLAAPGAAPRRSKSTPPAPTAPTPAPAPAAPAPAPAGTQLATAPLESTSQPPAATAAKGPRTFWASALVGPGFGTGGGPALLELSLRGATDVALLADKLPLQVVLPLTFQHQSVSAMGITVTTYGISLVPSLRVLATVHPNVRGYGELGLGLGHYRFSIPMTFFGEMSGGGTGLEFSIAAGAEVAVAEGWVLFFEPGLRAIPGVTTTIQMGGRTQTFGGQGGALFTLMVGAGRRLP